MRPLWKGFEHLAPAGHGVEIEPFDGWFARVRDELPHVPACVAEQWLHRHWDCTPFGWLPLDRLRFEKQSWDDGQILGIGAGAERPWSLHWSEELGREGSVHRSSWLGWYMLKHRTWPVPIIVLDRPADLSAPDGRRLSRVQLVEGRMRSAFHHHLATNGLSPGRHEVWWTRIA